MKTNVQHNKNTLKNYSKEDLIDHIICLEHNIKALNSNFEIQYDNCLKMVNNMNLLNDIYKNRTKLESR